MITEAPINISVPDLLKPVLESDGDVVVLHAPLDCRIQEVMVVKAIMEVIEGHPSVIVGQLNYQAGLILRRLSSKIGKLTSSGKTRSWINDDLGVSLTHTEEPETMSFRGHSVFMVDGTQHTSPTSYKRLVVSSQMPDPNHWISNTTFDQSFRLDAISVAEEFDDVSLPAERGSTYDRYYLLKDVEVKTTSSFIGFARRRLNIRSDRPLFRLTSDQKAIASKAIGTPIIPFEVSALQRRYLAAKRRATMDGKKPWFILLKYRRGGFTTLEQGMHYHFAVERPNSQVLTVAHTRESSGRIFKMADIMHKNDPYAPKLLTDSKSSLEFDNRSSFIIGTASGKGPARGDTLQRVHGSEVSKWCVGPNQHRDVEDLMSGLLGAASNGQVILESTPNGREWFCRTYEAAVQGLNEFTPIFVRWFDDPVNRLEVYDSEEILDTLSESEKDLIERHGLDLGQIAFRREQKKVYGTLFAQEMPEDDKTCFLTSGHCYFDVEVLLELQRSLTEPIRRGVVAGASEEVYKDPVAGRRYVIGVDTSEGIKGGDLNGLGVLDFESCEQVYSLHGLMSPGVLAEQVKRVSLLYNGALFGVERENHGHAVLLALSKLDYDRPHYYGGPMFYYAKDRNGWTTSPQTRPVMIDGLSGAINDGSLKVNDSRFVTECMTFRKQNSGKYEHDNGEHDDSLMKWAIALQMRNAPVSKPGVTILG